jgi:hypothetical protein
VQADIPRRCSFISFLSAAYRPQLLLRTHNASEQIPLSMSTLVARLRSIASGKQILKPKRKEQQ